MGLNVDFGTPADPGVLTEQLGDDTVFTAVGEQIVWWCVATRVGYEITEGNVEEFIARVRLAQGLMSVTGPPGCRNLELDDDVLRAAVGLRVNVGYEPRAAWLEATFRQAFPATDPEDCGTLQYRVSSRDRDGEPLEVDVWAQSRPQAVTKASRVFRSQFGDDYPFAPTWEWDVARTPAE